MHSMQMNIQETVVDFLYSLKKDPHSWDGWNALHVTWSGPMKIRDILNVIEMVQIQMKEIDGFIHPIGMNGIILVCQNMFFSALSESVKTCIDLIMHQSELTPVYQVFTVSDHAEQLIHLLQEESRTTFNRVDTRVPEEASAMIIADGDEVKFTNIPLGARKVLLVEDDPVTRWLVRNALKEQCYLATAQTASKAIAMVQSFQPDLIFLDIGLPDKDGQTVLQWIIDHDPGAHVVMFSSMSDHKTVIDAINKGASGYITKPFNRDKLLRYIHQL